ncbi:MAG: RluA family pseudouridine synthase [bacterium]|jgi:23S rRNA pseudouridine1911/1915/1917 synthase|nr:MAG: RNA pseudouridine synthase [bacterium]
MSGPAHDAAVERQTLRVEEAGAERLDRYLARRLPELSRSRIARLLEAGLIRLNGQPARKSERVAPGDIIEVEFPAPEPSGLSPEAIPVPIVYQDRDLAVVDKPAGLVVHPAPGHARGTLVHALLHHLGDLSGVGGVLRPGIVHRLDRDTSGLLLVAKNDAAHRALAEALKRREVRRVYTVAAWGHLDRDEIVVDAPIGRSRSDRKRMAVVEGGRPARTRLRRLERWRAADLLRAELETGRTHQIRVHLAAIGHPVVGDRTYGARAERGISGPDRAWAQALARRVPRQFLHATELAFRHPSTGEWLVFHSPLPPELAAAAEWARSTSTAS